MGKAQGALLRDDIVNMVADFFVYLDNEIAPYIKDLPQVSRACLTAFSAAHGWV
jgi:hypothetical protein